MPALDARRSRVLALLLAVAACSGSHSAPDPSAACFAGPIPGVEGWGAVPTIAIDALGRPVVGMTYYVPSSPGACVVRCEAGEWVPLKPDCNVASVAATPDGGIWGCFRSVSRLAADGWEQVTPDIPFGWGHDDTSPVRLAATPAVPYLAWTEHLMAGFYTPSFIEVGRAARLAGASWYAWWTEAAARSAIAASPRGGAYGAWGSTVVRLTDGAELAEPGDVGGAVAIAVGADGNPVLAYAASEIVGTKRPLVVKRWDGAAWTAVGGAVATPSAEDVVLPAVAIDAADAPVVAWAESEPGLPRQLHLARWDGAVWERVADHLNADPSRDVSEIALALDGRGAAFVAWAEVSGGEPSYWSYRIFVRKLDR